MCATQKGVSLRASVFFHPWNGRDQGSAERSMFVVYEKFLLLDQTFTFFVARGNHLKWSSEWNFLMELLDEVLYLFGSVVFQPSIRRYSGSAFMDVV
jgi:hypothetical protein